MSDTSLPFNVNDTAIKNAERLCFFSHFDADGRIDDYVLHYLRELRDTGFVIVLVTTATLAPGEARRVDGFCAAIVERENVGLDFGGWIECLARFPDIRAELLLLCNDSVYGPFWKLSAFIAALTSVRADFYGAVRSLAEVPHLQSWFLLLRPSAYQSEAFRALLDKPMPRELSKGDIITRYETVLTQALVDEGLSYRAAFDPSEMGPVLASTPLNPTCQLWRELLTERFVPFVKISTLRERPLTARGVGRWRDVLDGFDAILAAAAARNLARRLEQHTRSGRELLRELADWPILPLASLPVSHGVIKREVQKRPSAKIRNWPFDLAKIGYNLLRAPYVLTYRMLNRANASRR